MSFRGPSWYQDAMLHLMLLNTSCTKPQRCLIVLYVIIEAEGRHETSPCFCIHCNKIIAAYLWPILLSHFVCPRSLALLCNPRRERHQASSSVLHVMPAPCLACTSTGRHPNPERIAIAVVCCLMRCTAARHAVDNCTHHLNNACCQIL